MTVPSILPGKASAFMRALEQAEAYEPRIGPSADLVANVKGRRPPAFIPFMIYEYGLIRLLPYVVNQYTLLDEGRLWQIDRGTFAAVARALGWVDSPGTLIEAPTERNWWNSYQVRLDVLPPNDGTGLDRIAAALEVSAPMRSDFRRASHVYDVPTIMTDGGRLDGARLDGDSGIRLKANGPLWSFGRITEIDHTLTEAEGIAIGNWLEPVADDPITWSQMTFPWTAATFPWTASGPRQRRIALASWFVGKLIFQVLRDADGAVIGYRRCRVCRQVGMKLNGLYRFGADLYSPANNGETVYIEAMTAFDDANGVTAASAALVVGGALAAGVPAGRQWLQPDQLVGGYEIATTDITIPLRRTVRERFKTMLRF